MISLMNAKTLVKEVKEMSEPRLLLCTDMDRTIIPNGEQLESQYARKRFYEFCLQPQIVLVYVTGRHKELVTDALIEFGLPVPDYAITDVGTRIYRINDSHWLELAEWVDEIDKDWNGKDHQQLKELFSDIVELQLQENSKQNTHKLSYYVSLSVREGDLMSIMAKRLEELSVQASLVWSIDEPEEVGLLDVLPRNATKLHAIEFLRQHLGYALDEVVFAGDSGNDLPVLESSIPSVLVANAAKNVREAAQYQAERHGNQHALYCATGNGTNMNGNYSAGVLEGICHFYPCFRKHLEQYGFCPVQ